MMPTLHDVYYCQINRTKELSDRMYSRNKPSNQMTLSYFTRPVDTYATVLSTSDNYKPTTVKKAKFNDYNQTTMFNPGQKGPREGYVNNVDIESALHNSFNPAQHCAQSKFIPGSYSDMYNSSYLVPTTKPVAMTNKLLFKTPRFKTHNPNKCNLGHKVFHNHTDQQIKNLKMK